MFSPALSLRCSCPASLKRFFVFHAEIFRTGRFSMLVSLMLCLFVPSAWPQMSANLSGVVTDQSGATVSGADVTLHAILRRISRNASRALHSNASRYPLDPDVSQAFAFQSRVSRSDSA